LKQKIFLRKQKRSQRELDRLSRMHPSSAEYTVASTYLDWITALPWNEATTDNLDIKKARKVLDDDHYGLAKAKKRIIEYLSVRKTEAGFQRADFMFRRPPGTGKTSLGQSIAARWSANCAHFSGRRTRRSGNPRPSPDLHRSLTRTHYPGAQACRVE